MKKIVKNIEHIIITIFVFIPILYSCTDPLGIDDNVIKTPFLIDTIIKRDTIYSIDSVYIVRIDTVIAYKDTIIHRVDTVYLPSDEPTGMRFIPRKVNISIFEKYLRTGNDVIAKWHSVKGLVNIVIDTNFTTPILFISLNLENNQNNFVLPGLNRQEMAKEILLKMFGFALAIDKPVLIDGSLLSNRYGIVALRNTSGQYRYITNQDHKFTIQQVESRVNSKGKIIGAQILILAEYMSNSLRTNLEIHLDIDF